MQVIARLDRSPHQEIRVGLVTRQGQTYLDLRVFTKPSEGERSPLRSVEGISLPLAAFPNLHRAMQAVADVLCQRGAPPREAPRVSPMPGGGPTVASQPQPFVPMAGHRDGRHLGRRAGRIPVDCPVEYSVGGAAEALDGPARRWGRTRDLNGTGAQLALPERIPVLTPLNLTLHLPMGGISLPCEVVWVQLSTGTVRIAKACHHGVRFTAVGPEQRRILEHLLAQSAA